MTDGDVLQFLGGGDTEADALAEAEAAESAHFGDQPKPPGRHVLTTSGGLLDASAPAAVWTAAITYSREDDES